MTVLETRDGAFRQFRVLASLAMIVLLHSTPALAATITATTCGSTDVAKALDSASDGDTVAIPAGQCTWTANVSTSKRLTIRGAGAGQTIITDGVNKSGSPPQAFVWNVPDTGPSRMTGIEWRGNGVTATGIGNIQISGTASQFRMDHNKFVPNGTSSVWFWGYLRGVIDHNSFDLSAGWYFGVYVQHNSWNIPGSNYGDASYAAPDSLGTADALYFEDNLFTNDQHANGFVYANDGYSGSRVVFRYNTFVNTLWGNHGTESAGRWRSQRQFEIYNNTFSLSGVGYPSFVGIRGGTGVIFNNTATLTNGASVAQFGDIKNYRSDLNDPRVYSPWLRCDGANMWDGNTDSSGYPCLDQPGRGQGSLLSGFAPTPVGWPHQALEPIFQWNNTTNGAQSDVVTMSPTVVMGGRDFINASFGLFASRPTTCSSVTPQEGYWATDTRTLYRCTAPNTWTTHYTPYQYPHPLVSTPSSEASVTPSSRVLSEGVSTIPPTPTATGGLPAAATPLSTTAPGSSAAATWPSTTDVGPTAARVTSPQAVGAQPNQATAPRRETAVSPTSTAIPPATTDARMTEPIRPESPPLRVVAIPPSATSRRPSEITPGPPAAAGTAPQIVIASPGPRRNRALPVTVTSDIQLAHVKVFIDDKLVLTLATTAMNLRFSQSLPNRKTVMVRVEATDAGGNRATQRVAIPPANDVHSVAGDYVRSKWSKPLARE